MTLSWRSQGSSAVGAVSFIILYCFGLFSDTWVVVYRKKTFGKVIANMGLLRACGFNQSLQIPPSHQFWSSYYKKCFSLLGRTDPVWLPVVQSFAIVCLMYLIILTVLFWIALCTKNLTDRRFAAPLVILCLASGLLLLVQVIVFACNMRPSRVTDTTSSVKVVTETMYWGGFYLHCVAAGGINVISLLVLCLLVCVKWM